MNCVLRSRRASRRPTYFAASGSISRQLTLIQLVALSQRLNNCLVVRPRRQNSSLNLNDDHRDWRLCVLQHLHCYVDPPGRSMRREAATPSFGI
jgi:hypothetical protein